MMTTETQHAVAHRVATRREDWQRQMRNAKVTAVLDQFAAELTYVAPAEWPALAREYYARVTS